MSNIKKKIFDVSIIGLTDAIGTGIAAIFWFYIASTLGPESYGELTFLISIAALVAGITIFGSGNTLLVFSAKKIDIQSTLYIIVLSANLIAAIIIFILFLNAGVSLVILAYSSFVLVTSNLLGKKLYKNYSKYVMTQKILLVILGIGLYYLIGEIGILIGIALSHAHFIIEIVKTFKKSKINFNILREKKNFILNNFAISISGTFHASFDKLIIAPLLGFVILGNYSLGLQFLMILALLPATATKYLIAQESSGLQNKKLKKIMIFASIGIAVLGTTVGPMIISNIFPKFEDAQDVIRILSLAVIPTTINYIIYFPKFYAEEKNRKILFMLITIVITQILLILSLGPIYGSEGIAIAFVISAGCGTIVGAISNKFDKNLSK